jgi:cytoskeleton protein RodZ
MSEAGAGAMTGGAVSAGRLLREARQAQGLHIAALANAIKVTPRKLELLEGDRLDELPDATFTRALAQTVCRSLKVDAAPILALLPPPSGYRLEQLGEGLNTPFRDRPARLEPNDWGTFSRPAVWGPLLLLLAAGAVYLMPPGWLPGSSITSAKPSDAVRAPVDPGPAPAPSSQGSASASVAALPGAVLPGESAAPPPLNTAELAPRASVDVGAVAATAPTPEPIPVPAAAVRAAAIDPTLPAATATLLRLHAAADSWMEVLDARGQPLLSRVVRAGETVDLDGTAPLRVKVGNARATGLTFRGRALELAPFTRDNIARLELK